MTGAGKGGPCDGSSSRKDCLDRRLRGGRGVPCDAAGDGGQPWRSCRFRDFGGMRRRYPGRVRRGCRMRQHHRPGRDASAIARPEIRPVPGLRATGRRATRDAQHRHSSSHSSRLNTLRGRRPAPPFDRIDNGTPNHGRVSRPDMRVGSTCDSQYQPTPAPALGTWTARGVLPLLRAGAASSDGRCFGPTNGRRA